MLTHEQVTLPDGVQVDVGIATLLNALWELGLRTSYSCQGTSEEPLEETWACSASYISFPEAADALTFFSQTLGAVSTPDHLARIVVDVRYATRARPGWELLRRGPAVTLELSVEPGAKEGDLRGCVRFDPDLMPLVEAAFVAERA